MTTPPDPKVVLQAHALRTQATQDALLHGTGRARTPRALLGAVWGSLMLAVVIVVIVVVTSRIVSVLSHTHH